MMGQLLLVVSFCFLGQTLLAQNDQQSRERDLEQLLSFVVPFAEQTLAKYGEFFPYGSSMNSEGKIAAVAGYTGSERPKSAEVIDLLRSGFRREGGRGEVNPCGEIPSDVDGAPTILLSEPN
jgi:hypothetical protein